MSGRSTSRFRWLRWFVAVVLVAVVAAALRRVAVGFGPTESETWRSLLRDDIDALVTGDVSRDAIVRGTLVVMTLTLVWIAGSLVTIVMSYRRSLRVPRTFGRWAAFFVCGGAMVASSTTTAPVRAAPPVVVTDESRSFTPRSISEGASDLQLVATSVVSGLVGAGLAIRLRARDHAHRRQSGIDDRLEIENVADTIPADVLDEMCRAEKSLDAVVDIVTRIRRLTPDGEIRHVIDERNGWYVVEFTHPVKAVPCTQSVTGRSVRLRLEASPTPIDEVESLRLPMLMHVGRALCGEVWVSLDAYRDFGVDCASDEGERVWLYLRDSLVLAPTSLGRGLVSDDDLHSIGPHRSYRVGHVAEVESVARRLGDSIAVVHGGDVVAGLPSLRRITSGRVETGLSHSSGEWRLLPSDIAIRPVGTGDDDIRRIRELLGDPLPVIEVTELSLREENEVGANDSGWTFMAQVLGPPRVVDRRFETVEFERGKAEELVIWLAFHPQQRKRSLARTALWLSPVRDATFSNITAAARRSLNAVTLPPSDQTWVGITLSDDLPLAEGVVTDVDLLRDAVDWARRRPEDNGLQRLREALQLVRGVPFAGSTYTWSDGIGMSGEAAMLVVRAASMMAEMCQEIGDMSGVYWASAKGLLALPGHEELVAIRLRAHAEHGDRVAMKAEWESYRRAVASEWGDAEPSPKMMELWRRLGAG
ncbi:MAG: hypothetical protein RIS41_2255 [Actinomycetota bacterium]